MKFDMDREEGNIIKVIGVGGGGGNAVNYMYKQGIVGVDFAICNTDKQVMDASNVPVKIQLGPSLTDGKGAGSIPSTGRAACEESVEDIRHFLGGDTRMVFITAGMGGGTGTGAAPIVAKVAQELDILTVGIVTIPFKFEGRRRTKQALDGLDDFKKNVDTLIVIENNKLREYYGSLKLSDAFSYADDILTTAAKGIAEIITVTGLVNVDFEDVNTVMRGSGAAIMGTAVADGDDRALEAVEAALKCPLLQDADIKGAKHILLNITSGSKEVTMDETCDITDYIEDAAGEGTDMIWGNSFDESLGDKVRVTVIATGFEKPKKSSPEQMHSRIVDTKQPSPYTRVPYDQPSNPTSEQDANNVSNKIQFDEPIVPQQDYAEPHYKEEDTDFVEIETPSVTNETRVRLNKTHNLRELEDTPAYERQNINIDERTSKDNKMSNWSSSEDEPLMNKNNTYFYDNID